MTSRLGVETPPRVSTPRRRHQGGGAFKYLAVLPLIVLILGLIAFPLGAMIWMAFGQVRIVAGQFDYTPIGFGNFERIPADTTFITSLVNSAVFIIATVVITVVLGTILALLTDRMVRGQQLFQNVLILPAIIAPVVISIIWLLLLSPQFGLINKVLSALHLPIQTLLGQKAGAMAAIIGVDVWHWTPIVFLFVYTALRGIDSSIIEAASVDGASAFQTARSVILPLLVPAIAGAAAIRVVMGVKVFDEMYLLTFGGPGDATTVISIYLRSVIFDRFDYGYGAALSLTVLLIMLVVVLLGLGARGLTRRFRSA